MRRTLYLLFSCLLAPALTFAQGDTPWTLQRAVDYALENNLQVKRLNNLTEISQLNETQARNARLPSVSASTNVGAQLGRTIDPTTNEFNQQTIGFQGYNLQANVILYNGGSIKNQLAQSSIDLAAAELDAKVTGNNIALQVANSYLNIVLFREQLKNARAQLTLIEEQLANTDALIRAGSLPPAQRFDFLAQQAASQRTIVELENQERMAILGLQILLELPTSEPFNVTVPDLDVAEAQLLESYDPEEVYQSARGVQPTVLAAELRRASAEAGIEVAKSGLRPTVSLFGSLSTNYSTVAKDFSNPDVIREPEFEFGLARPVQINGQEALLANLEATGGEVDFPSIGYLNQLDRNFGQSVGLALNVPIFNQGRNRLNVQRAEIVRRNADVDIQQSENQLRNDVQLALANLRAAQEGYRAARVSQDAAEAAYTAAQQRFRAGAANSLDLVTAQNRYEQAQTEFVRSKYQLLFNRQVIRFYLGQGFSLN